jgi:hypothetical protein
MPGDRLALEESDRVANGDGGAWRRRGQGGGFGDGHRAGAQPATFDKTDYGAGVEGENRGAALAASYGMTEEEHVSRRGGFFELSRFVGEDFAGRALFLGNLECMSILELWRMKRKGDHGLAADGWLRSKRQKRYFVLALERIWRRPKNGDVVFCVHSNDGRLKKARRAIRAADQDVGLAAVAKGFHDVGDRQKVTLFVNKEGVAKETVVVTARRRGLVELINDGAHGGGEIGVVSKILGRGTGRQAAEEADKNS